MGSWEVDDISGTRERRSPRLLILVFAASLALVGLTAVALVRVVTDHVSVAAVNSTMSADRSLVQSVVEGNFSAPDMSITGPTSARVAEIQGLLQRLVAGDVGILRLKVHSLDGTVLFSDDTGLRGTQFELSPELEEALEGQAEAEIATEFSGEEADLADLGVPAVLEEYLPIVGPDGEVEAVFEVYRDATSLLAEVGRSQVSVVAIIVVCALVLGCLLWLIFRAAQARLDAQTAELIDAAKRDALTGLLNHGAVVETLAGLVEAARTTREAGRGDVVTVAIIDIDNFRNLNDTHGHAAGDRALREVSAILRTELSQASVLGRFGPDEFLAVAPPECAHDLQPAVERLRTRLVDLSLQFGVSERLPLTVSAGLARFPSHGAAATELLSAATVALGEAKASGGDQVCMAEDPALDRRSLERGSFDVLQGLVIAIDTKDRYTKRHSDDVARYGLFLAEQLGVEPELRRTLYFAGLLHDVGKIGIPDTILRKPAALTADEYAIVKQHVALGDLIVRELPDIEAVRAGVRHHHERWDGTGYLDGLAGEDIPLVARILAVGDAFSAMTTSRPYRKALSTEEALRRLIDAADSQLDPSLVPIFVAAMESLPDAPLPGTATSGALLARPMATRRVA
ncbi:MAG: diguanylate cyclase [Candidatus Limnocylindrales bacterium]